METNTKFKINNLDLLRFFAALQVALWHAMEHLQIPIHPTAGFLIRLFPGVPIFFFISGLLISRSFENNPNIFEYLINRAFRIYPALILCSSLSLMGLYSSGFLSNNSVPTPKVLSWFIGQITFVQFYNPSFFRNFGVGVINGSLWTIAVELQFYILVPLVYRIIRTPNPRERRIPPIYILTILFGVANLTFHYLKPAFGQTTPFKLIGVTFIPWFYMFLIGVIAQRNFEKIHNAFAGKGPVYTLIYVIIATICIKYFGFQMGNGLNAFLFSMLACAIFAIAYTKPNMSKAWLKGNDVSYGIYIFHMPIVNFFIYYKFHHHLISVALILISTICLATISWFFVEKPTLRLKRHPLIPLT